LSPAAANGVVPAAASPAACPQGTDFLITVAGASFSVLRADYESAAAAASKDPKASPKPEARMPGSPRKGLEQRVAKLTTVFDSAAQLASIAADAGVADVVTLSPPDSTAGVAVEECPVGSDDSAAGGARRCAFITVAQYAALFVFDVSDPAAPAFQSLALPPKMSAEDESSPFVAQSGITYAK
jgi:hypothetical protein